MGLVFQTGYILEHSKDMRSGESGNPHSAVESHELLKGLVEALTV